MNWISTGGVILSALCALITIIKTARAPYQELLKRIEQLEDTRESLESRLGRVESRLDNQEAMNRLMLRTLSTLCDHGADGNHIKQLAERSREIQEFLIRNAGEI